MLKEAPRDIVPLRRFSEVEAIIKAQTGTHIPDFLKEILGLEQIRWALLHEAKQRENYDLVFVGCQNRAQNRQDLEEPVETLIRIDRQKDLAGTIRVKGLHIEGRLNYGDCRINIKSSHAPFRRIKWLINTAREPVV